MNLKYTLTSFCLVLSVRAFAEGPYLVGEVTHSNLSLDKSAFNNDLSVAGATGLNSSSDGSANQWRLQAGYQLNPYFSVEAGYIDFGKASYKANFSGGTAKGNEKAGGLDIVALGILPVTGNLSIFAKGGVVAATVKSELASTTPAAINIKNSSNEIRPLIGAGAIYNLQKNLDLRVDFDRVSGLGKSGKSGSMNDNMASVGIAYRF